MKYYGSLSNRFEENGMYCDKIEVGTGMTEYLWSDRHAYEVVEVKDQKHVKVREYDHKVIGEPRMGNNHWELISNENNPVIEMAKRGNYWYSVTTITKDILEDDSIEAKLFLMHNGVDPDDLRKRGTIKKYYRMNVSFGVADYYFDYEF